MTRSYNRVPRLVCQTSQPLESTYFKYVLQQSFVEEIVFVDNVTPLRFKHTNIYLKLVHHPNE